MLLLRWSSDVARKVYARLREHVQASLLDVACDCPLDTVRAHILHAVVGGGEHTTSEEVRAAQAVEAAALLISEGALCHGPSPASGQAAVRHR